MEILNRQAKFNYIIEDTYECGIVLKGTEIKSVRLGNANIQDSYGKIKNNECFLINMYISSYKEGNQFNHEETRERKLLLHKREILKLKEKVEKEGYTLIPLKVYFKDCKAKVSLGVAKGKKLHDKRETIKDRDLKRQILKEVKEKRF